MKNLMTTRRVLAYTVCLIALAGTYLLASRALRHRELNVEPLWGVCTRVGSKNVSMRPLFVRVGENKTDPGSPAGQSKWVSVVHFRINGEHVVAAFELDGSVGD